MTTRLKALILAPEILVMPGVHDALSAKIAEATGHVAISMGGFAATGALLGQPDTSQLGMSEMAEHCARVCEAVEIPMLADADTGFGNVTNVRRTVREFERAGVAGLFIEDQVFPKRCGHTAGKAVVSRAEFVGKIKSAVDARIDADFVIMARTDALAVNGLDDALERIALCAEAGADLLFIEAPESIDQMRAICRDSPGSSIANMVNFGQTPLLTAHELHQIGYSAVVYPISGLLAVTHALTKMMKELALTGTTAGLQCEMTSFEDFTRLVGLPQLRVREQSALDYAEELLDKHSKSNNAGAGRIRTR